MSRCNRVDPWGDLRISPDRGMFTGNRGCLVDESRRIVRHDAGNLWITCATEFRDWKHPLDAPHRWTPLFFLDDAVALAAGHRPCAFCRRNDYHSYRDAVAAADTAGTSGRTMRAMEINRALATQRLRRGRGVERRPDRITWRSPIDERPDGTVILGTAGEARVLLGASTLRFAFDGWSSPLDRSTCGSVEVLTPPLSVDALRHGFRPTMHPTAAVVSSHSAGSLCCSGECR